MLTEVEPARTKRGWLSKDVAARIRAIRRSRGKTLNDLAKAMKTTPQTVQRLETDNMTVSLDWLEAFAKALDVHPVEFFGDHIGSKAEARAAKQRLGMLRAAFAELCRQAQDIVPDLVAVEDHDEWSNRRVFKLTIGGRYQNHMKLEEIRKPAGGGDDSPVR